MTTPKTMLVTVLGERVDLMHAMFSATNGDWRALTAETGVGPFTVAKRLQALKAVGGAMSDLEQSEDETDAEYDARMAKSASEGIGFDEDGFVQTITILAWLARRKAGVRETYQELEDVLPFWEAMGAFQQVKDFNADEAKEADASPPASAPKASDQDASGAVLAVS